MRLGILNMPYQIIGQVRIKIKTSLKGGKESNPLKRICLNQEGRASSVNKISLPNLPIFVSKFKAKNATEEQSQCLEESQNCFESKVGEGFRFIDLNFFIEQLRRGCCTRKSIISHTNCVFF